MQVYLSSLTDKNQSAGLLKKAAALYTGEDTAAWHRAQLPDGKPYFKEAPELHFSVSHSGSYWACAFGSSPLGLDLQMHKAAPYERLARRFFREDEIAWLLSQGFAPEAFFRIWTAKESYLKRQGSGFPAKLGAFSILAPLPDGSVLQYPPAPEGYTLCLCTEKPEPVSVIQL